MGGRRSRGKATPACEAGVEHRVRKAESLNGQLSPIVQELARSGVSLVQARAEFERQLIVASLRVHEGNHQRSAEALGIHRNTLRNKLSALRIESSDYRPEVRTRRRRQAH